MKKLILLTIFVLPNMAFAGFNLNPSFGIYKSNTENNNSQIELRLGYTFDMGVFVGGFYTLASDKFIDDSDEYYLGPIVGYQWNGLYGLAGYVASSAQDMKSGGTKYSSGEGYQATIGYRMLVAEDMYLGPELEWRNVKYSSKEIQGVGAPTSRKDTVIIPSIAVNFVF